jgi:hypothetical protein
MPDLQFGKAAFNSGLINLNYNLINSEYLEYRFVLF